MDIQEFNKKIAEQFLEEDQLKVSPEIEFRKLGTWDSLTGMAVITVIEDDYGVSIPVDVFIKLKTVKELYDYVVNQKQ